MTRMMELDRAVQGAMMRAMPGVCTRDDVMSLVRLREGYRELQASAQATDILVTLDTLNDRVADVTEWIGRAHDSMNEGSEAVPFLREARQLYAEMGNTEAVTRIDDRLGEILVTEEGDLDSELKRVRKRLADGGLDTLDRVKMLILLGELLTKAGDDFEAEQPLLEAEGLLSATPNLSHEQILEALVNSTQLIAAGSELSGEEMPVVQAMQVRALYQRLYFALGNVYRETDPAKAKEYEEKLSAFDDRGGGFDPKWIAGLMEQFSKDV